MSFQKFAQDDFERAVSRGFWRKILSRLTGEDNSLLPYDEVRQRLSIRGQHYVGLRQVETNLIVGSTGRYHDFDRAFLPLQRRTKNRWVSIDQAHYEEKPLPPVDLIKIGDIYFVRDGNHRVSVARERGQAFIDAYVIEVDVPVKLSPDTRIDELELKQAYAEFLFQTGLEKLYPGIEIEASAPDFYRQLLRHIDLHRWYLGEKRGAEVAYSEAVQSWYEQVYLPLAKMVQEHALLREFPGAKEADLCLWLMDYRGGFYHASLRQDAAGGAEQAAGDSAALGSEAAARKLLADYPLPAVKKLVEVLNRSGWLDELIVAQEKADFMENTGLASIRPQAELNVTLPRQFERLYEHIAVHRWYLGEQRKEEVSYAEAVASWYDHVYLPLVEIIRQQGILSEFPGRTETDLYLWIITHRWHLQVTYGEEVPLEAAAEDFTEDYAEKPGKRRSFPSKMVQAIKKALGRG